ICNTTLAALIGGYPDQVQRRQGRRLRVDGDPPRVRHGERAVDHPLRSDCRRGGKVHLRAILHAIRQNRIPARGAEGGESEGPKYPTGRVLKNHYCTVRRVVRNEADETVGVWWFKHIREGRAEHPSGADRHYHDLRPARTESRETARNLVERDRGWIGRDPAQAGCGSVRGKALRCHGLGKRGAHGHRVPQLQGRIRGVELGDEDEAVVWIDDVARPACASRRYQHGTPGARSQRHCTASGCKTSALVIERTLQTTIPIACSSASHPRGPGYIIGYQDPRPEPFDRSPTIRAQRPNGSRSSCGLRRPQTRQTRSLSRGRRGPSASSAG